MNKQLTYILTFFMTLLSVNAFSQSDVEMADAMRSNGKIYVIVAIILIILIGLIGYLFFLDRKVSRIEKNLNSDKNHS